MKKTFTLPEFNYEVTLDKFARQADGAVWFKRGGTVLLATACSSPTDEFPGFLPLTVDYREWFSAAGKIPGGYFKREGKFSDTEVLTSRLMDRSIRPLFPSNFYNQLQVLVTVYSVDKEHAPHTLSLLAASLALTVSKIPFLGPVGVIEVARIDGQWIYNPTYSQTQNSKVRFVIAGTKEGINMVEGSCDEVSENEFVDVLFTAHEKIKQQVEWQESIAREMNVQKEEITDTIDWTLWTDRLQAFLTKDKAKTAFKADKVERGAAISLLVDEFKQQYAAEIEELGLPDKVVKYVFDSVLNKKLTELIFDLGHRFDGRSYNQVRAIEVETGLLPCVHGSAFFQRGRTQALVSLTLGGGSDAQSVENLMGETASKRFMLHYNFPPFSVGEVRPMRGPGRREVGHGHLALSAIDQVLPPADEFPYTIRIVADMLESDGSTSMATVCGSTMALMDAGVPIKSMVSGVAMGLLQNPQTKEFQAITDISGLEDAYGLMDFKVAGTERGITAIQMDIKYKGGLPRTVFEKALAQAHEGRAHIRKEMQKVMTAPRAELSSLVPKIVSFKIPTDKIGAVIGSGGKVIREIIEKTGTTIDIEDDGMVKIFGQPGPEMDQAINWVKMLSGNVEVGITLPGTIKRIADFGLFVEIAPGLDGLVHVSMIPRDKQKDMQKIYKPGDQTTVHIMDYDPSSGRIRLKIVEPKANDN